MPGTVTLFPGGREIAMDVGQIRLLFDADNFSPRSVCCLLIGVYLTKLIGQALFRVSREFTVLQISRTLGDEAATGKHLSREGTDFDCTMFFG